MGRHRRKDQLIHPTTAEIPYFDPTSPTHIKAQMGSSAYLPCKIKNLGNKSVSECLFPFRFASSLSLL